jgi:hypothetical protein
MHASPKMLAAVKAVIGFGVGLGLLGILLTEHPATVLPMVILGTLVGVAWAGGLVHWWSRSKSTSLYAKWLVALLVLVIVATITGLSIAAACALGGYGLALFIFMQIREWRHKKTISWQDLWASRNGKTM